MKGFKITIPPYMPDYNPVENFFNTVKSKFCSRDQKQSLPEMAAFVIKKSREIPKVKFVNYFLYSVYNMLADLLQFHEPEKYGAPKDKVYAPPPLPEDSKDEYRITKGRYISTRKDPNQSSQAVQLPKPEVEAGQTKVKLINRPQKPRKFDSDSEWEGFDEHHKEKKLEFFGTLRGSLRILGTRQRRKRKPGDNTFLPWNLRSGGRNLKRKAKDLDWLGKPRFKIRKKRTREKKPRFRRTNEEI